MNIEEFKNVIGDCITNPDKLAESAEEIIKAYEEINDTNNTIKKDIEELKSKNDELRERNVRMAERLNTFNFIPNQVEENTNQNITEKLLKKINERKTK